MADLVPATEIERIVGVTRHQSEHYGRAVSDEQTVYVLHSAECLNSGIDLRDCSFSLALDHGIEESATAVAWSPVQDRPVRLKVTASGRLFPSVEDYVAGRAAETGGAS